MVMSLQPIAINAIAIQIVCFFLIELWLFLLRNLPVSGLALYLLTICPYHLFVASIVILPLSFLIWQFVSYFPLLIRSAEISILQVYSRGLFFVLLCLFLLLICFIFHWYFAYFEFLPISPNFQMLSYLLKDNVGTLK